MMTKSKTSLTEGNKEEDIMVHFSVRFTCIKLARQYDFQDSVVDSGV